MRQFKQSKFMRTRDFSKLPKATGCNGPRMLVRGSQEARPPDPEKRTILLISDDARLHQNLKCVANTAGRIVVRVGAEANVVQIVYAIRPAVVLLDLDLAAEAAWEKADALL